jgi:hypothetical protein
MKNVLLYVVLLVLVAVAIFGYNAANQVTAATVTPTSTSAPWQPARLRIDALHINAPVLAVGTTADGKMDAPVSKAINSPYWTSVFWYAPGAAPGQVGNAVVAGHVDKVGGDPAVFWSLSALKKGDVIVVITQEQKELRFGAERVVSYPADTSNKDVLDTVFGASTEHHLNLITCNGSWTDQGYDQRLVVFTTLMNN